MDVKHVDCVTASDRAGARHKPCQLRDPQPPRPACPPPPPPPRSVALLLQAGRLGPDVKLLTWGQPYEYEVGGGGGVCRATGGEGGRER